MIKIKIWYKDESENVSALRVLRNLKPRRYMLGWDFEKLLKYIEKELYWEQIEKETIKEIVIYNEKEQWQQNIKRTF